MAEPCGYYTCLIMMKHVLFSPNLYTTALTVLHVMFTVTFKREAVKDMQTGRHVCSFNSEMVIEK
jgi:hypothetical protein